MLSKFLGKDGENPMLRTYQSRRGGRGERSCPDFKWLDEEAHFEFPRGGSSAAV